MLPATAIEILRCWFTVDYHARNIPPETLYVLRLRKRVVRLFVIDRKDNTLQDITAIVAAALGKKRNPNAGTMLTGNYGYSIDLGLHDDLRNVLHLPFVNKLNLKVQLM